MRNGLRQPLRKANVCSYQGRCHRQTGATSAADLQKRLWERPRITHFWDIFRSRPSGILDGSLSLRAMALRNESGTTISEVRSKETVTSINNVELLDGRGVTVTGGTLVAEDVMFEELGSFSKILNGVDDNFNKIANDFFVSVFYDLTEGGAILNQNGVVEITDSVFVNNGAGLGGSIAQFGGQLSVEDTEFIDGRSASEITTNLSDSGPLTKTGAGGGKRFISSEELFPTTGSEGTRVDGAGVLIFNEGGVVELRGAITESGSLDEGIARISTDTPVVGEFTVVADAPEGLIDLRAADAAGARIAGFAAPQMGEEAVPELAHASFVAAAAAEIAGPLLVLGEGVAVLGDGTAPAFGVPTIENGVITVVIAGLTVRFSGDDLTLDVDSFDVDDPLASLATLGGLLRAVVVEDADGVEVLRLTGLEIPAADIPATLATLEEGEVPNLLDLFGIAPAVQGGDSADVLAGGGGRQPAGGRRGR